jgi:hypothetical protein
MKNTKLKLRFCKATKYEAKLVLPGILWFHKTYSDTHHYLIGFAWLNWVLMLRIDVKFK